MQATSAELFARVNDLTLGEDVSGTSEMRTDAEYGIGATAIDPTIKSASAMRGGATAGGTSAGGSSTAVASGQPSSEASSEGSDGRVVCMPCCKEFPNRHGHSTHFVGWYTSGRISSSIG
eukprot:5219291-Prymnesium_polylepis.1